MHFHHQRHKTQRTSLSLAGPNATLRLGGPDAARTRYLLLARQVLSQLSYWPISMLGCGFLLAERFVCLLRKYRILPYLNGNHTFITPMVAMAVPRGIEPRLSDRQSDVLTSIRWDQIFSESPTIRRIGARGGI